jgi:aspartate kinase
VEIIAGSKGIYSLEVFDPNMAGQNNQHDQNILAVIGRFKAQIVSKDTNANTITHYLSCNLKTIKRIRRELEALYPEAEIDQKQVAIVSAIGSDLRVNGILAKAVKTLAEGDIGVQAMHQSMRQVDMQFVVEESDYEAAIKRMHEALVEVHDHGLAICAASI